HAHAGAARAVAGADRVDALGVRLDGDLRAVSRLAGDAADLDEPVGDLRHLELEQRLDQLRVAPREDHLRALRARAHLRDHGLDPRALLVALAVDLLGARQERLDLAEVDEDVVAVARLLDDPGDDLADAVDVLVVHHPPLLLADPLQDHLLRGLCGDAAEALGRHVLTLDLVLRHVGPVDVEVVVGDERVLALARLLLEPLQLLELALAGLVEEPFLDVRRQLDRVDAEVAVLVHLDRRVPRGPRRLLVGGEEGILERGDERALFDPLVALDLANRLDDLLAHLPYPSSIRLARTICSYGISVSPSSKPSRTACGPAARTSPRSRFSGVRTFTRRPTAAAKCSRRRSGRSSPGEDTSTVYSRR